jgi:hypothetical protein
MGGIQKFVLEAFRHTVDYQIAVAFVLIAILASLFTVAEASKYRKRSPIFPLCCSLQARAGDD